MDSDALVALFRSEMADEVAPYLWSDTDLYSYEDDAQKMFCRLRGGIADSTSTLTTVTVPVDAAQVARDERILAIRHAYRTSDGQPVSIVNYEDLHELGIRFDGKKSAIEALILGMDERFMIPYPVPNVAETVRLVIERLPLEEITGPSIALEIESQHHRHLLMWMKKLAYEKQDAETFDKMKSVEFEDKFVAYCELARKEKNKAKHKTRVVQYGGLPMGHLRTDDYGRR